MLSGSDERHKRLLLQPRNEGGPEDGELSSREWRVRPVRWLRTVDVELDRCGCVDNIEADDCLALACWKAKR